MKIYKIEILLRRLVNLHRQINSKYNEFTGYFSSFYFLLIQISANHMTSQYNAMLACKQGVDDTLKFNLSITMEERGDLHDFHRGRVAGETWAGLSI